MEPAAGTSLPEGETQRIFDWFHQAPNDNSQVRRKGSGLGLAISREIVGHFGGKIWVESQVGKGSEFFFTIPVTGSPNDAHPVATSLS